ncbi:MAG: EAL domain-containing protein, partial [Lachnospiraceae bacterium]|nr:EAL domain-containing protein [Lachnospiraceae bacterium]
KSVEGISVLIENRKKTDSVTFLSMLAYIIIPGIATIIQSIFYGYSFVNISIGFVLIIMFIQNSYSQSQEVLRISKLEVRTGLLNEHGCIGEIETLRSKGKVCNYCAVYFDISKFSYFNRKYGMIAGDMLLKKYSENLCDILKSDEFLAREGSDHFIAVVKKENLEKILDFLKETEVEITYGPGEGKSIVVKVSSVAGVYEINEEYMKAEDILSNAYTALLYAKTVSKKSVDYMSEELKEKLENERKLKGILFEGLEKEEFQVYYQPKIDMQSNTLCGGEALVRWMHDDNVIPPEEFIPIMEKNDSVCTLDFYVLRKVCEDIKEWQKEGLDIPTISVNLSRRNLSNTHLAKDIDNVVKAYGISKDLIEIEITETSDEFPASVLKEFVSSLHELGYKVAVDDFGCGAASLSLLRETDFDTLKIDKGFIHSAFDKNLTILTHIVNLAKAIDMKIVAEGVETQKQKEILMGLGVNVVQGYFYDRPLPKEEMSSRITGKVYSA